MLVQCDWLVVLMLCYMQVLVCCRPVLASVEMYDINTGKWTTIDQASPSIAEHNAKAMLCEVTERPSHRWVSH